MAVRLRGFGAAAVLASGLCAQAPAPAPSESPLGALTPGVRITGASVSASYYSVTPEAWALAAASSRARSDYGVGGSVTATAAWARERSWFVMSYTPSYYGRIRYSEWNSTQHGLSLNFRRRTSELWTTNFSVSAAAGSVANIIFSPGRLSRIAGSAGSAADLGSAALGGVSGNTGLDAAASQAALLDPAAGAAIYGSRILSASGAASASYAHSSRFNLTLRMGVNRIQSWRSSSEVTAPLIPHSEAASAGLGFTYALSPRTQFGVDADTQRVHSRVQDYYRSHGTVLLSHRFTTRTFGEIHGGAGMINPVRQSTYLPTGAQYQAGGMLGYRTFSHTLMVSVEREAGDSYGLGASASLSASLAWIWRRPDSSWWFSIDGGQQFLTGRAEAAGSRRLNSWRGTAGLGRRITARTGVLTQYGYLSDSGAMAGLLRVPPQHIVRVSFVWLASENAVQ